MCTYFVEIHTWAYQISTENIATYFLETKCNICRAAHQVPLKIFRVVEHNFAFDLKYAERFVTRYLYLINKPLTSRWCLLTQLPLCCGAGDRKSVANRIGRHIKTLPHGSSLDSQRLHFYRSMLASHFHSRSSREPRYSNLAQVSYLRDLLCLVDRAARGR